MRLTLSRQINELIEKILFRKDQLDELKIMINKLDAGELSPIEVRTCILKQKEANLKKLIGLIPFIIAQAKAINSVKKSTKDPPNNKILSELQEKNLQEKNRFLEEVAIRVNSIVEGLIKNNPI